MKLPEGVRTTIAKRDFTVATIVGRAAEEPAPGAAVAAAAEPGAEAVEEKEKPKEREKKKEKD